MPIGLETYSDPASKQVMALVIRSRFEGEKYNFITPPESPLQVGVNFYESGDRIQPHAHLPRNTVVRSTQEFIWIKKGVVLLQLYNESQTQVHDVRLSKDDCVLLISGGHGFHVLEGAEFVEVKQGPFSKEQDKIRFEPRES